MLGDKLAMLAVDHGWEGVVVYGCVRDTAELQQMPLGVVALAACPMRSVKRNEGQRDVVVRFAGLVVKPLRLISMRMTTAWWPLRNVCTSRAPRWGGPDARERKRHLTVSD